MAINEKVLNPEIKEYLDSDSTDINIKNCLREVRLGRGGNLQQNVSGNTYCMSRKPCILQEDNPDGAMSYCNHQAIYADQ